MILAPGSRIGILGGGQLGRMLAMAAARLGFDVSIYSDTADSPAARVAADVLVAGFEEGEALREFAVSVDAITMEFENVPACAVEVLAEAGPLVRPNPRALSIAQDRVAEKTFFTGLGIETTAFAPADSFEEGVAAFRALGGPAILKTRRLGYDGKGQYRIDTLDDCMPAFAKLGGRQAILERRVAFAYEVSVIAARAQDGGFAAYDVGENEHADGILRRTLLPGRVDPDVAARATRATRVLADALDYVGVLCVEFFVLPDGRLLANEFAPRVHNSGHWTEAAADTSQFEQHIRAVAGWPLGSTRRRADVEMINLIGPEVAAWREHAANPRARLQMYGKRSTRDGRKMGHVTLLGL